MLFKQIRNLLALRFAASRLALSYYTRHRACLFAFPYSEVGFENRFAPFDTVSTLQT